jgi:uncharacterized protein (DUF433 family)
MLLAQSEKCRGPGGSAPRVGGLQPASTLKPDEPEELLSRISIDPNVCFGKSCLRGRRIWVSLVLDLLAGGMKPEQLMEEYDLTQEDILACIAYGAAMARERYVDLATGPGA